MLAVQRVAVDRERNGEGGEEQGDGDDPEGTKEVRGPEAHGWRGGEAETEDGGDDHHGEDVERALPGAGCPEDEQDEAVAEGEFEDGAAPAGGGEGGGRGRRGCIRHRGILWVLKAGIKA